MKSTILHLIYICVGFLLLASPATNLFAHGTPLGNGDQDSIQQWMQPFIKNAESELAQLQRVFLNETEPLRIRLHEVCTSLNNPRNRTAEKGFELLWEREQLRETLQVLEEEHNLKMLKLRYRKSIEIVKMLYEKVLSMDHHFTSLKAQQTVSNLSNPHNYPEFKETKTIIDDKMKKKFNFQMPALFQTNPYLSAAFTVVGMITSLGEGNNTEKKENMQKLSCILDFTVRMHNDLNVIYYETGYLRDANLTLKKECEMLFAECSRQVGYSIPLTSCRDSDDWERLYTMLDNYVAKALGESTASNNNNNNNNQQNNYGAPNNGGGNMNNNPKMVGKATVNLQFSIDRVTQFIEKYGNFVGQGAEYYKKFSKIADSYENEKTCSDALPAQFKQLKTDIDQTLDKFNSAYRMPEVQGSKLKDMLYGTFDLE
jgi:hypothetical protein